MKQFRADIIAVEKIEPGLVRVAVTSEGLASSRPGQFFSVRPNTLAYDPYLRATWFAPRGEGPEFDFWLDRAAQSPALLSYLRPGASFDFIGPLGHGFRFPAEAQRLLVVGETAGAAANLLGLIDHSVREGREVAVICGEPALPEFCLPPQVEYQPEATETESALTRLLLGNEVWTWADALAGCGSRALARDLERVLQGTKNPDRPLARTPRLQVALYALSDIIMPCGTGACYTCAVETRAGLQLVCRDGPVLDLHAWSAG